MKQDQSVKAEDGDARLDVKIVELFDDVAEAWEFLSTLPDDVLAQLRERQRRGELDRSAIVAFRARYRYLLSRQRNAS